MACAKVTFWADAEMYVRTGEGVYAVLSIIDTAAIDQESR